MNYYNQPNYYAGFKVSDILLNGVATAITGASETKIVTESAVAPLKTSVEALQAEVTAAVTEYTVTPAVGDYTGGGADEWKYTIAVAAHLHAGHPVVVVTDATGNEVGVGKQYKTATTPVGDATIDIEISLYGGHNLTTTPLTYYVR